MPPVAPFISILIYLLILPSNSFFYAPRLFSSFLLFFFFHLLSLCIGIPFLPELLSLSYSLALLFSSSICQSQKSFHLLAAMATSSTTSRRQRAVVTVLLPLLLACLGPPASTQSLSVSAQRRNAGRAGQAGEEGGKIRYSSPGLPSALPALPSPLTHFLFSLYTAE